MTHDEGRMRLWPRLSEPACRTLIEVAHLPIHCRSALKFFFANTDPSYLAEFISHSSVPHPALLLLSWVNVLWLIFRWWLRLGGHLAYPALEIASCVHQMVVFLYNSAFFVSPVKSELFKPSAAGFENFKTTRR